MHPKCPESATSCILPKKEESAPPRRVRTFRELSQQILLLASRPDGLHSFLSDACQLLTTFTASDGLEMWVLMGRQRLVGWSYDRKSKELIQIGTDELTSEGLIPSQPDSRPPLPFRSAAPLVLRFGTELCGWLELRSVMPAFYTAPKLDLYQDIALTLGAAIAFQRAHYDQRERVKELSCLYQIARLGAETDRSEQNVLSQVVHVLPPAWQYPEITVARIVVEEHVFATPRFNEAVQVMRSAILVRGRQTGVVEVGYTRNQPLLDEGPFLQEEQRLLDAVSKEIAQILAAKWAEAERVKLGEQLRHADRLATIGQLAAGVAHELNEPLGSILGFAQLAQKTPDLPDSAAQDLNRIEAAALHSREVVRKLSLFARQSPTKRVPLDMTSTVRDGLFLLESRCRKEGVNLVLDLAEGLPEVEADAGQMTQVVLNLVVNALQATPTGGTVRVATAQDEGGVCLMVQDHGPGMPSDVAARIFEPFFTTKDVGEGTGLGLSVVHGIVAAHAGRIRVQTAPGRGTTFVVILPVKEHQ